MRRGDLVTVVARGPYLTKPRPAVIIQSDAYPIASVTLSLITAEKVESEVRIPLVPNDSNHLERPSWVMIDKTLTVPRSMIGRVFGRLSDREIAALNRGLALFLDIAVV